MRTNHDRRPKAVQTALLTAVSCACGYITEGAQAAARNPQTLPAQLDFIAPVGMTQIGNSCFFNAAVQALMSIPTIRTISVPESLYAAQPQTYRGAHAWARFVSEYATHVAMLHQQFVQSSTIPRPPIMKLSEEMPTIKALLVAMQQDDASGAMNSLLTLFDGTNLLPKSLSSRRIDYYTDRKFPDWSHIMAPADVFLQPIFTQRSAEFNLATTNIFGPPDARKLKFPTHPSQPSESIPVMRQQLYDRLGDMLGFIVISDNGLVGSARAYATHRITFPLALTPPLSWCTQKARRAGIPTYHLRAIVCHQGSTPAGGHYVAYARYQGRWYYCSDFNIEGYDGRIHGMSAEKYIEEFCKIGHEPRRPLGSSHVSVLVYEREGLTVPEIIPASFAQERRPEPVTLPQSALPLINLHHHLSALMEASMGHPLSSACDEHGCQPEPSCGGGSCGAPAADSRFRVDNRFRVKVLSPEFIRTLKKEALEPPQH